MLPGVSRVARLVFFKQGPCDNWASAPNLAQRWRPSKKPHSSAMGFTTRWQLSLTGARCACWPAENSRAELRASSAPSQEGEDLNAVRWLARPRGLHQRGAGGRIGAEPARQRLGAARIRQELQAKGLGAEAVQQAMARLQELNWNEPAGWRRKFGEPAADPQTRAKHMRFCWPGFSGDVVPARLQGAGDGDED